MDHMCITFILSTHPEKQILLCESPTHFTTTTGTGEGEEEIIFSLGSLGLTSSLLIGPVTLFFTFGLSLSTGTTKL